MPMTSSSFWFSLLMVFGCQICVDFLKMIVKLPVHSPSITQTKNRPNNRVDPRFLDGEPRESALQASDFSDRPRPGAE